MTSPRAIRFRATVELGGKTATGIPIPPEIVAPLGGTRHPPVRATVAGYSYPSTVASMRGHFMLPVSAAVRAASGVAAKEDVEVELELDTEPREVVRPADFAGALAADAEASRRFAGLSCSKQLGLVLPIDAAKSPETPGRRIDRALAPVRDGAGL